MGKLLKGLFRSKEIVVILLIVAIFLILSLASGTFLNATVFESLQTSIAPSAIISAGMMILLISGVFDLSVGSVMGLAGALTAILAAGGVPVVYAILVGLATGLVFGLVNGGLVAFAGVNPLITTLGTMYIGRGLVNAFMRGERRYGVVVKAPDFLAIGQGKILGIYNMFWIMLIIVLVAQVITMKMKAGRRLYYIGSNYQAARLVGIKVKKIRVIAFTLCGLLAAFTGILVTSYMGTSSIILGTNVELQIIISCLIGGASISGGQGLVVGSLLGVIFMTMVSAIFNILEIGIYWQNIIVGIILVFIVGLDAFLVSRRKKALGEI
ncbi:MAG: ABC transporter permease [Spirochaetia bacterium]|jgi:ribose/xylose/arabinose/galactoside ABC-type transport system permease subunit